MSFVSKLLASVGIGSATVDTKLQRSQLVPGETVEGIVEVKGGNIAQDIDGLYLTLFTTYERSANDNRITEQIAIGRYQLTPSFGIQPNEVKQFPFSFQLPVDTPVTIGKTNVWVQTGLDIKNAIDPSDRDHIEIVPTPLASGIFAALETLGFRMRSANCEEAKGFFRNHRPFVQEFEFSPVSGEYRQRLDELEVVFLPQSEGYKVIMEVDRRARGFSGLLAEAMDKDETKISFIVTPTDIPTLPRILDSFISRYC